MNATTVHIRAHTALTIMRATDEPNENIEERYASIEEKLREMQKNKSQQIGSVIDDAKPPADVLSKLSELEVEDLS